MEFGRRPRGPVVDLRAAGEPELAVGGGAEQRLAQCALGRAEGHRLDAAAVVAGDDRADVAVADDIRLDDADRAHRDARGWPAHAVGAAGFHRFDEAGVYAACREDGIEQQRSVAVRAFDGGGEAFFEEVGEGGDRGLGDRQAGGHRVASARHEQAVFAGCHHSRTEVDAGDRAARALADAVLVDRDDDRGAA